MNVLQVNLVMVAAAAAVVVVGGYFSCESAKKIIIKWLFLSKIRESSLLEMEE